MPVRSPRAIPIITHTRSAGRTGVARPARSFHPSGRTVGLLTECAEDRAVVGGDQNHEVIQQSHYHTQKGDQNDCGSEFNRSVWHMLPSFLRSVDEVPQTFAGVNSLEPRLPGPHQKVSYCGDRQKSVHGLDDDTVYQPLFIGEQ